MGFGQRDNRHTRSRALLLIVVALVLSLIVLGSAVKLLPPPPGPPTPTAPHMLDRPEGKPRILH